MTLRGVRSMGLLLACAAVASPLVAQSLLTAPTLAPQPTFPASRWAVVEDADGSEQGLTALEVTGPLVVSGPGPHVVVDRRWVLTPPYRVSARVQLSGTAAGGVILGLLPQLETGRTGTAWIARTDGTVVLERRVNGDVVSTQVQRVARTATPLVVTLTADVSPTEVVFEVNEVPVFKVPVGDVDVEGSPGVWLAGAGSRLDTFSVTVPAAVAEVMPVS